MSDFRSALLRLGDDTFFEIFRNYLGPVKTPFNKHELIGRLEAFLRRSDIQERIVELIDDDDAEVLSAVWMLGEPDFDEAHLFFGRHRSYLELHQRLLNLEDRLLVYREDERLRINPILVPLLEERVLRPERLFAARRFDPGTPGSPWLSDTLLLCIASYLHEHPDPLRADGTLRKRGVTDLAERLPALLEPAAEGAQCRAEALIRTLVSAGAAVKDSGLHPVPGMWAELAMMSPLRRLIALAAAAADDTGEPGAVPGDYGASGPDAAIIDAAETVLRRLPAGIAISGLSFERLLLVTVTGIDAEVCRRVREQLAFFGVLAPVDEDYVAAAIPPEQHEERKPLVVQPNFAITLPQELSFADGLFVARLAQLTRHDRYPHFELTKERLAAELREGLDIEAVIDRLDSLAAGRLPQNVRVTLRSWAQEHESVRLYRGIVLTVEAGRRYAVEHAEPVRTLIRQELAPGVYLVDERDLDRLQSALATAGIDLVPKVAAPEPHAPVSSVKRAAGGSGTDKQRLEAVMQAFSRKPAQPAQGKPGIWLEEVRRRLADDNLEAEQREELSARVGQKLILTSDQIDPGSLKRERTEARGLDYVGKVRIIEQAIRSGTSFLEVIERSPDGSPRRRLVEPSELAKQGNDLVLRGEELPSHERVELLVRKLGLVRRMRSGFVRKAAPRR